MFTTTAIHLDSSQPRISFGTTGTSSWPAWDRFLLIDGRQAFWLGNICETCAFLFEKREHASRTFSSTLSAGEISERLRASRDVMSVEFLKTIGEVLPQGCYRVILRSVRPTLVMPCDDRDYFRVEHRELFGVDSYYGVPHSPRTPYYRCPGFHVASPESPLFEFIVPLHQPGTLDPDCVERYQALQTAEAPTALAVGVLDVKGPANPANTRGVVEHWCLVNYLLDGHHKLQAAACSGGSLQLLTFLSEEASCASAESIDRLLEEISDHAA
jgi:hypothetical protein